MAALRLHARLALLALATGTRPNVQPSGVQRDHPGEFPVDILGGFEGFQCPGGPLVHRTTCRTLRPGAYARITESVEDTFFNRMSQHCDDVDCERGDFGGCILRFVGHDLMDFNEETLEGGTDACIDFDDPDNTGLRDCLDGGGEFGKNNTIERIFTDFCHEVSLADLLVIMGEALMVILRPDYDTETNKSPTLEWGSFSFGRQTMLSCAPKPLPDPRDSCFAVEDNFIKHLGLNWTEAAAFMGVHTVGRTRAKNSGFDGWWTSGIEGQKFDNEYYVRLLGAGWVPKQVVAGDGAIEDHKWQWVRSDGGPESEVMLNTDICMLWPTNSGCHAEDVRDHNCCLWASKFGLNGAVSVCYDTPPDNPVFDKCCRGDATKRCGNVHLQPSGSAPAGDESAKAIIAMSKSEEYWLKVFKNAWYKVTGKGKQDLFTSECVDDEDTPP